MYLHAFFFLRFLVHFLFVHIFTTYHKQGVAQLKTLITSLNTRKKYRKKNRIRNKKRKRRNRKRKRRKERKTRRNRTKTRRANRRE